LSRKTHAEDGGTLAYVPFGLLLIPTIVVLVLLEIQQTALGSQAAFSLMLLDPVLAIAALIALPYKGKYRMIYKVISAGAILYMMGFLFLLTVASNFVLVEEQTFSDLFASVLFLGGLFTFIVGVLKHSKDVDRRSERKIVVPLDLIEAFRAVEPDKSFETPEFFVFRKERIHILLKKYGAEYFGKGYGSAYVDRFMGTHFVKMFEKVPVQHGSAKMPFIDHGLNMERQLNHEVGGVRMIAVKVRVTIPVDVGKLGDKIEVKYMKGASILYFVPTRVSTSSQTLDRSHILKILEDLSNLEPKRPLF
jgi:hypothetical protein